VYNRRALGQGRSLRRIGVVTSTKSLLQIALLHWYGANVTTTFSAGRYLERRAVFRPGLAVIATAFLEGNL
jgi:hypothetical protein